MGTVAKTVLQSAYTEDQLKWLKSISWGTLDDMSISLVLCGKKGYGSRLHIDWAQADNGDFSMLLNADDGPYDGGPLALWLFIDPKYIDNVMSVMTAAKRFQNKWLGGTQMLTADDMIALQLAANSGLDETAVILIYQHAHDVVHVPVGFPHAVVNLEVRFLSFLTSLCQRFRYFSNSVINM